MITDEERSEFPYHAERTILTIRWIRAQTNERLLACINYNPDSSLDYKHAEFQKMLAEVPETSAGWLMGRIGGELYDREVWSDDVYSYFLDLF